MIPERVVVPENVGADVAVELRENDIDFSRYGLSINGDYVIIHLKEPTKQQAEHAQQIASAWRTAHYEHNTVEKPENTCQSGYCLI